MKIAGMGLPFVQASDPSLATRQLSLHHPSGSRWVPFWSCHHVSLYFHWRIQACLDHSDARKG